MDNEMITAYNNKRLDKSHGALRGKNMMQRVEEDELTFLTREVEEHQRRREQITRLKDRIEARKVESKYQPMNRI